ncbi:MAG: hypothetical protein KKB37_05815 [Alphaproteobacteria bacterium]|nr:hypothetical protein [Alphaproteobacteria bacterium]
MSRKVLITSGIVAAAIGVTAIVAHAERGDHYGRGHHGGYEHGDRDHHGRGWGRHGKREVTKEEYDAETRARFAKWDANSDGVVDRAEIEARIARHMERRGDRHGWGRGGRREGGRHGGGMGRMMDRLDSDNDGKITRAEIEAEVAERFKRMDLTNDGRITDDDLPPMMRGRNILSGDADMWGMQHGHRGMRMIRYLQGADANNDGAVTLEEVQARAAKRIGRLDRNNDGTVDETDREALRKEMTDYRVLRFQHRYGAGQDGLTLEQFTKYRNDRFAKRDADGDDVLESGEMRGGGRGHHMDGDRGDQEGRGMGRRGMDADRADERTDGDGDSRRREQ